MNHGEHVWLVLVLDVAHPAVVALLADTIDADFGVLYPLSCGLSDFDVDRFDRLEFF